MLTWLGVGDIADNDASDDELDNGLEAPPNVTAEPHSGSSPFQQQTSARLWAPLQLDNGLPVSIARALAHQVRACARRTLLQACHVRWQSVIAFSNTARARRHFLSLASVRLWLPISA